MKTVTFSNHEGQTITAHVNSQDLVFIQISPESADFYEYQYVTLNRQDVEELIQYLDSLTKNFIIAEDYPNQ